MRSWRLAPAGPASTFRLHRLSDMLFILRGLPLMAAALLTWRCVGALHAPAAEPRVVLWTGGRNPSLHGFLLPVFLGAGVVESE